MAIRPLFAAPTAAMLSLPMLLVPVLVPGLGAAHARATGFHVHADADEFLSLTASRSRLASMATVTVPGLRLHAGADDGTMVPRVQQAPVERVAPRPSVVGAASLAGERAAGSLSLRRTTGVDASTSRSALESTTVALSGGYQFTPHWGVVASVGSTIAQSFAAPTIGDMPRLAGSDEPRLAMRTDFVSVGVLRRGNWLPGDTLALSLGQPRQRVVQAADALFYAGDLDGVSTRDRLALRPSNRELLAEIHYFAPLTKSAGLGLSLANRSRLASEAGTGDERIMSIRFATRF